MAASHASIAGVSGAEPECCEANEHGTATVCKTGQECKTASILQLVSIKAQLMPAAKPVTTPYNGLIPSSLLDAVWHPPRVYFRSNYRNRPREHSGRLPRAFGLPDSSGILRT